MEKRDTVRIFDVPVILLGEADHTWIAVVSCMGVVKIRRVQLYAPLASPPRVVSQGNRLHAFATFPRPHVSSTSTWSMCVVSWAPSIQLNWNRRALRGLQRASWWWRDRRLGVCVTLHSSNTRFDHMPSYGTRDVRSVADQWAAATRTAARKILVRIIGKKQGVNAAGPRCRLPTGAVEALCRLHKKAPA